MLFEDDFFPSGYEMSQRRSQSVGRPKTEYRLLFLARELPHALLPGSKRENTSPSRREGVMQTQLFRKAVVGFMVLGLAWGMLAILSCGSDDDDDIERQATLLGANERPLVGNVANSPGSGTAVLTINDDRTQISYTVTYTGLTNVVQGHIHVGGPDVAGPIILYLCTNIGVGTNVGIGGAPLPTPQPCPQGPSVTITGTLTTADLIPRPTNNPPVNTFDDAVTQILNGNTYTNIHTDDRVAPPNTGPGDFPGGEIRGQN
jgi:hypothetical protein